jgi:hypothetical protein
MSLAVLADHMASKGRGNDSMLVHMTPREVAGLQALAKAHGGSLTINPDTGLPEAGWVDKLLPAVIGFAVNTFAPGIGTAIGEALGTSAAVGTGIAVGGAEALRTGDISRGLQAGLGAYGGAGLSAGMMNAGTGALTAEAAALAGTDAAAIGAAQGYSPELIAAMKQQAIDEAALQGSEFTAGQSLSKGFDLAKANPMQAIKDYGKPLMYAAGPAILAAASTEKGLPQTVTKPGMIRPYSYNPYSGGFVGGTPYEAAPTKAAEGGLMGMAAGGYSPGMFDFAQKSEPVVRMAEGGIAGYAPGGYVPTDAEIFNYFKTPGLTDAKIAQDMQTFGVSAADIARATGTQGQQADYEKRFVNTLVAPTTDASEFMAATKAVGLQDQALANAMQGAGMSQGAQYALTHALNDAGYTGGVVDARTGKPVSLYTDIGYTAGALPGDQGGLEGLYGNINYVSSGLQNLINTGKMSVADAQNAALAELARTGVSVADVKAATGKSFGELFTPRQEKKVLPPPFTSVVPGETKMPGAVTYDNGAFGNYGRDTGNPLTSTPGDIITNPDGTRTVVPNIPGRPYGGFSGMGEVRNAYTAGGGSLGYIPYAPKTIEEFDAKYNKLTGGSKQAYDYLMGKTPYSAKPFTPTGEVQKPYNEAVLGMPANTSKKMFIFDPATKTYKVNPDYAIPTYDSKGNKTYNLTNKDVLTYMATKPSNTDFYNWAKTNNLSVEQIAAATGMPITEVQKMLTGGTPADTNTATGGGSGGTKEDTSYQIFAEGGLSAINMARGGQYDLGDYSDGGRLLRGPGDGVSDSIPASIGNKRPARLADGEFVVPARIVSELGNGSTEAGARKLYGMMDRIQAARRSTVGKGRVAKNSRADKHLPA